MTKQRLNLKKEPHHALRLEMLFQTKKNINILNEPGTGILGCAFWKVQTEKKRKIETDFFKKFFRYFIIFSNFFHLFEETD